MVSSYLLQACAIRKLEHFYWPTSSHCSNFIRILTKRQIVASLNIKSFNIRPKVKASSKVGLSVLIPRLRALWYFEKHLPKTAIPKFFLLLIVNSQPNLSFCFSHSKIIWLCPEETFYLILGRDLPHRLLFHLVPQAQNITKASEEGQNTSDKVAIYNV